MSIFCRKPAYSVCRICSVHFEPAKGFDLRWKEYCPTHRKEIMERDLRIDAVVQWASANWEKLEPQYLVDKKALDEERQKYMKTQQEAIFDLGKGLSQNPYFGQSLFY